MVEHLTADQEVPSSNLGAPYTVCKGVQCYMYASNEVQINYKTLNEQRDRYHIVNLTVCVTATTLFRCQL